MSGPSYHGRTHTAGGTDPIPGVPGLVGPSVRDIIISKSPVGLWKLDESSGNTAADSSGAGNHMTVPTVGTFYEAPTWGEPAGPPGTTAALFAIGADEEGGSRLQVTMPSGMTDDFSAGLWVYINDTDLGPELMGQGIPIHSSGGGWTIYYDTSTDKFRVSIGGGSYPILVANNTSPADAWYLVGFSRIAGTWTLYIDGVAQADTDTQTPTAEPSTWIGDDGHVSINHGSNQTMSWAFITDDPLSGDDWSDLTAAALSGGVHGSGLVWTTDGAGGASWQEPTIEVEF